MKKALVAGLTALSLAASGVAIAQPAGNWDLNRRENWLQERIDRGVADGSLTRGEAHRVERQLRRIRRDEARLTHAEGGVLRDRSRVMLERRLDDLSDHIRWARHNDVARPW